MDAHGERHGEEAGGGLNEQAHRLQRVPQDEFRLGCCFGLLMQELDRRHLAAARRDRLLLSPTRTHLPLTRSGWGNSRSTTWVHSAVSRSSFDGGAVEVIDEGIVATSIEVQCAHYAGHAQHVRTHGEARHGGGEPEEGLQAGGTRGRSRCFRSRSTSASTVTSGRLAVDLDE